MARRACATGVQATNFNGGVRTATRVHHSNIATESERASERARVSGDTQPHNPRPARHCRRPPRHAAVGPPHRNMLLLLVVCCRRSFVAQRAICLAVQQRVLNLHSVSKHHGVSSGSASEHIDCTTRRNAAHHHTRHSTKTNSVRLVRGQARVGSGRRRSDLKLVLVRTRSAACSHIRQHAPRSAPEHSEPGASREQEASNEQRGKEEGGHLERAP